MSRLSCTVAFCIQHIPIFDDLAHLLSLRTTKNQKMPNFPQMVVIYREFYLWVSLSIIFLLDRVKRIWYLSPVRAAKVQASLRIRAVSPEPSLLAHTSSESRGTFRQKARSLAPLNGWACAVKICHDGMLEDTNSLDGAVFMLALVALISDLEK